MENIFKPAAITDTMRELLSSIPVTLEIAVVAAILGLVIGFMLAIFRIKKLPVLSQLTTLYISFVRGTPLLVQIFLSYYGIPMALNILNYEFGTSFNINKIPSMAFVFVAFSLNEAAYMSEAIRASILSVDQKDVEAAHSIGMTGGQTMRRVILPQAMLVAIPNLGNSLISLIKSTSLAFTIGVMEMTGRTKVIAGRNMRFFEAYIGLALLYWALCILVEFGIHKLEKKFNILDRKVEDNDQA
jgi:His/Glu/Gln/Arg/opine family amino acid ABC transporter permease subunit